jgi:2-dehydro-3-deoxy-D-arabinonate dehydratase
VVTDGEPIGIRVDSLIDVPEPELALVLSCRGEVVGYTVCNDMSSRNIEGENPLYLPQAKVYAGSCALAAGIRLADEVDATDLGVRATITRDGETVWEAATSTAQLHRKLADLAAALFAGLDFPDGAVLSTGTGIVPDLDVTTRAGDVVTITIDEVGTLTNRVVAGTEPFAALSSGRRPSG